MQFERSEPLEQYNENEAALVRSGLYRFQRSKCGGELPVVGDVRFRCVTCDHRNRNGSRVEKFITDTTTCIRDIPVTGIRKKHVLLDRTVAWS